MKKVLLLKTDTPLAVQLNLSSADVQAPKGHCGRTRFGRAGGLS
jgi:hypothetical protein